VVASKERSDPPPARGPDLLRMPPIPLRWEVVNKQERTYTILRDRINSGSFAPLDRLNIDALARELGVSPIPVREALRRLEAEGWVRFTPNVGAVVSPVDATSWEQSMVALAILEGAASAEAQQHLRRSDLTRMRKISAAMEEAAARADPLRFSKLNRALHAAIVARCPNSYLLELLEQTNLRLDRLRSTMFVYLPHRSEEALREHVRLIELLADGGKDDVESYARWHKLQTVEAYRAIHKASEGVLAARQRGAVAARAAAAAPDYSLTARPRRSASSA
jgi:DNA-binding GntR family transcriptional regulator